MALLGATVVNGNLVVNGELRPQGLYWQGETTLPQVTSPEYFLTIDAFASGGRTKYVSKANLQNVLGLSSYLPLAGGTMTGVFVLKGNQYSGPSGYAMNANNSDIIGINGLFTADLADNMDEGINFYRSSTTWDSLTSSNGVLYYKPNHAFGSDNAFSSAYTIYHSGNIPTATFTQAGIINTGVQKINGLKTIRFDTRIYPMVGAVGERSSWYKITFPYSTATTTSSAKWFMNSFDIHIGGGYSANATGVVHVAFYWMRAANNGAWTVPQAAAKMDGILMNKIALYYRTAEPGILYVYNSSNTYNGIWLDNLFVDDTSPGLDWSTTTIEACSAIEPANYGVVPTVRTYNNDNTDYMIGNHTYPSADNTYYLGGSSNRWKNIYAVTFTGALDGNAATASIATNAAYATVAGKISDLTTSDAASSTDTWRRMWFSYNDNTTGRPAYSDNFAYQTSTNTLKVPHILLEHASGGMNEVQIKYGSTVDMALMVGTSNQNHGLYDNIASKWMIYADANGNVYVNGNATTATTAANASQLEGHAASYFATSTHTHTTSIATSTGTNQITLTHGGKFAITAGGTSYIFTMPSTNFAGTTFYSGNQTNAEHNANSILYNGHYYYSSNGPAATLGNTYPTDGALYAQAYSTSWVGQIAQNYRDGSLYVRGNNNGTWTPWKAIPLADSEWGFSDKTRFDYDPIKRKLTCLVSRNTWDSAVYSIQGYTECRVTFKIGQPTKYIMAGLNSDPTSSSNYQSIDYCWYPQGSGALNIYESGTSISVSGHTTYSADDEFTIEYVNGYIRYYHNGVLCRSVARAIGTKLYFDSSFYDGGNIYDVVFSPLSNHNHDGVYIKVPATAPTSPGMYLSLDAAYDPMWVDAPSISNATITIKQTGISDQTFTLNGSAKTITLADTNTWRPLGTGASDACAGNDSRLSNARPASDVYAWAKAATKPSYSFSEISSRGESWLQWGGQKVDMSPIGACLSEEHSANRLAYINGDLITVEYSRNGGSTWTDQGLSATQKSQLCTLSTSITIGNPTSACVANQSKTRITITAQNGTNPSNTVYTDPRKMLILMSTAKGIELLIEYRTGTNYESQGAWTTFGTYTVSGWSGWNDIPLILGTFGGDKTQKGNNWQLRFTFTVIEVNSNYPTAYQICAFRLYGANMWSTPSTLAQRGHMYTFDMSKNVFFPAAIYEAGTALSSKYIKVPAVAPTTPGMILGVDAAYDPYWYNKSDIWRPLGTGANDACAGNDSRLSNSRPASDVYAWAKASTKPSYTHNEIGAGNLTIGDGANTLFFRTNASWASAIYHNTSSDEAVVFLNKGKNVGGTSNYTTSWIFAYGTPSDRPTWTSLTPAMQIKSDSVVINKLLGPQVAASYNLDVNGTLNATTIYENGTALSSVYIKTPATAPSSPGMILGVDAAYDPYWYDVSNTWRPLGTGATDACAGNDSRLSNARPASDVYSWAKASTKPSYTYSEVGAAASSHHHSNIVTEGDNRSVATTPNDYTNNIRFRGLKTKTAIGSPSSDTYSYLVGLRGWSDSSGGNSWELALNNTGLFVRQGATTAFGDWLRLATMDLVIAKPATAPSSPGMYLSLDANYDPMWVNAPTNTTYTFTGGTNKFTVTPSSGSAYDVTVTPSISNNVTGTGTSGYIAKFNGAHTITNGPAFGNDTTKFLRNDGTWAVPSGGGSGNAQIHWLDAADNFSYDGAGPGSWDYTFSFGSGLFGTIAVGDIIISQVNGMTIDGMVSIYRGDLFKVLSATTCWRIGQLRQSPGYCLTGDTLVTMADGSLRRLDEVFVGDEVLSYDWSTMELVPRVVIYTDRDLHQTFIEYEVWTFDDGSVVKTVHPHEFYNVEAKRFKYMQDWKIGEHTLKIDGSHPALVKHEVIREKIQHYQITLEGSTNYFANGLLTGDRNNPTNITL